MGLNVDNVIYLVTELNHVKPGKGSAFVRVRLRNIKTGQVLERTFRSSESLDDIPLEDRRMQHLYRSADKEIFLDLESYEQVEVAVDLIGEVAQFLQENMEVTATCYHHDILKVTLPNFIIAEVKEAGLGLKGDSSRSGNKPVVIDTGATVQVPLFINTGEKIKIDTRTGTYVERVK